MEFKITNVYINKDAEDYKITYDHLNKKRPSWIRFEKHPEKISFIKILLNNENFWYRLYFENYFFPLLTTPNDYEYFYDEISKKYESFVPQNSKIGEFILNLLEKRNLSKNTNILEICAGTGLISEKIVGGGYKNYTLLDCSKKCLDVAKNKNLLKNCKFIKTNLLEFKSDEKFDLIISSMGLDLDYFNHSDMSNIFSNFQKILKSNGLFVCIDRHIYYDIYKKFFENIESSTFFLESEKGKNRYECFVGRVR